ncbi:hypothetical protein HanXRQr2_Chr05g0194661 [Helianthus annuus]|uniref:Uncharacterized protein n=1 Tax=Helianthus annuus TaxID=4232 RepID=A0A9K3IWP7_HELAN|nr:hypothetical protein HanXRQr2_Chr05g0194661 [Helianthus annuus]
MVVNLLSDLSHVTMLSDLYLYLIFLNNHVFLWFLESPCDCFFVKDSKCFESDRSEVCVGSPCW